MKAIFIEFTRPKGKFKPISRIIRLIEGTPYSHIRIRFINRVGDELVYEVSGTSVKFVGPLALEDKKVDILYSYEYNITRSEFSKMIDLCVLHADLNYGYLQLFGIHLVRVFNLRRNPLSEGRKSQVCSEIVGRFVQEILKIDVPVNLDIAGPKDIKEALDGLHSTKYVK